MARSLRKFAHWLGSPPQRILRNRSSLASCALVGAWVLVMLQAPVVAQESATLASELDRLAQGVEHKVIEWRRDIHEHPELGNREFRTAEKVATHLRSLGLEVQTGVAHTGVVGFLRGGQPGPLVALRADMDALPVTEEVDLPFRSTARTTYNDQEVGVMHACGHDTHVAILMGVAEVLAAVRQDLAGSVTFIFQPAEEGVPYGEEGGADLMLREGVFDASRPDAVFGLHVGPGRFRTIGYRSGPTLASSDDLDIRVRGKQTHAALPWRGVDPIVVASQIVLGLQTITSRQVDLRATPAIVTVGMMQGGVRRNIVPDDVILRGTIRAFDEKIRTDIHERVRRTAEFVASSAGATAEVTIRRGYPVTVNDPTLTQAMTPTLRRVAGDENVETRELGMASEDFSYFAQEAPGLFIFLGVAPEGADLSTVAPNHSPRFYADEGALIVGVRALANLAVDYMSLERTN